MRIRDNYPRRVPSGQISVSSALVKRGSHVRHLRSIPITFIPNKHQIVGENFLKTHTHIYIHTCKHRHVYMHTCIDTTERRV